MIDLHMNLSDIVEPNLRPSLLRDQGPPRALYSVTPRSILGKDWWDTQRKLAYANACYKCQACGGTETPLEAHEVYLIKPKLAKVYLKEIVALCHDCHQYIHLDILISKKLFNEVKRIKQRGDAILKKAGITSRKTNPNLNSVPHYKWRLVIDDKEYAPTFDPF